MNNPMHFKSLHVFILLIFILLENVGKAQIPGMSIEGPVMVCNFECAQYTVTGIEALPPGDAYYLWSATAESFGGTDLDFQVTTVNDNTIEICWDVADYSSDGPVLLSGHLLLNLYVNGQNVFNQILLMHIGHLSASQNFLTGEHCPFSLGNCSKVCEGSVMTYSIYPLEAANDVVWEVIGSNDYVINDDHSLTVHWNNVGAGKILAGYALSECLADPIQKRCVDVIPKPLSGFTTDPPPQEPGVLKICRGQEVRFVNQTLFADHFQWALGIGLSTEPNPIVTYDTPGVYEVSLLGYNDCNCLDTTKMTIVVEDAFTPAIHCKSTVCVGETATYQTDADCGHFTWTVNGLGMVTAGGGASDNFVTVNWLQGGTGLVALAVDDCPGVTTICQASNITQVPVIANNIGMEGRSVVCLNERAIYSIPEFSGTAITWIVQGGAILSGQGTSSIAVRWPELQNPIQRRVIANYNNCYLGCSGTDTLNIFQMPEFKIEGDIEACADGTTTHTAVNGSMPVTCHWSVVDDEGATVWTSPSPAASVTINWPLAGTYTLQAVPVNPADFCIDKASARIAIANAPAAPGSIIGDVQICIGETYFYKAGGVALGAPLNWRINNGGVVTESSGAVAEVLWGASPPYEVSLTQTGIVGGGCISAPTTLVANPLSGTPSLEGPATTCIGATAAYTAAGLTSGAFHWSIQPPEAGVVVSNQNSATVQVQWNRIGPATLRFEFCNGSADYAVVVQGISTPMVVAPATLCEGATQMVQTTTSFATYTWKGATGSTVSTEATPELSAGFYTLVAEDNLGCKSSTVFHIAELPAPVVRISAASLRCLNLGNPNLYALNTVTGYEYQWLLNSMPINQTTPVITATQPGIYQVLVNDINGCQSQSNLLSVVSDCGQGGGGGGGMGVGLPPGAVLCQTSELQYQVSSGGLCHIRNYSATGNNLIPVSVRWRFGDPESGSVNNMATGLSASHAFTNAGFYEILLLGDVNQGGTTATCGILFIDTVWALAGFAYTPACSGEQVLFTDRSTFIPTTSILAWQWDFGDPSSGVSNTSSLSNPTHVFSAPGNYTVTLTVTSSTGCISTRSEVVSIFGPPPISVTLPAAFCEKTPYLFTANTNSSPTIWTWNFDVLGGSPPIEGNGLYYAYALPGTYEIRIDATSRYGCVNNSVESITVGNDNGPLGGVITSTLDIPFCEGDTTILHAPPGGTAWEWSTGSTLQAIGVSSSGSYSVAVTDPQGCRYVPPPLVVRQIEGPRGYIRAIEYSPDYQPLGYTYDQLEVCEGEDVYLEVITNAGNQIQWSNGLAMTQIEFSSLRGSLLPAGTHEITVGITDTTSHCTTLSRFTVIVHPKPAAPTINVNPSGALCEGTQATFWVTNPDPILVYLWSTGQTSDTITSNLANSYAVQAFNPYHCSNTSNTLVIRPGPNLQRIPVGCYEKCRPDTICVGNIQGVGAYQWFLNGSPIPGATTSSLVAAESGIYNLQVTLSQAPGCSLTSEGLVLDLYDGVSPIGGHVFFDVNNNHLIDAEDTLVANIGVILDAPGSGVSNAMTGANGDYLFPDHGAGAYTLEIDTAQLSDEFMAIISPLSIDHSGCNPLNVNLLIGLACPQTSSSVELAICEGSTITYGGITVQSDTTFSILHLNAVGCDSVELVQVHTVLPSATQLDLHACEGDSIEYNGISLALGSTTDFVFTNLAGCDSTMTVHVTALPTSASTLHLQACQGSSVSYNGTSLQPGTTTDFVFTNTAGCDSTVTVSVLAYDEPQVTEVALSACAGEAVMYAGTAIPAGESAEFTFATENGCDSVVMVSVSELPAPNFEAVAEPSCPETATGIITVTLTGAGQPPYEYLLDGFSHGIVPDFSSLEPGSYTVTVRSSNGCHTEVPVSIPAYPSLVLILDASQILPCNPPELFLQPTILSGDFGNPDYLWSTGATAPGISISDPGDYWVEVTNICETQRQTTRVQPSEADGADLLYVPNAFSPNNDGINELFIVQPAEGVIVESFELLVFDRWGNFVFSTTDINAGWNGQFRNRLRNTGVYVWRVEARVRRCGKSEEIKLKGDVTLIR